MQEQIITAPTTEPVSLALAKQYLRVTHRLEDAAISGMISAARKMLEDMCHIAISPQRWQATYRIPEYRCEAFGLLPRIIDPERMQTRCVLPRKPITAINAVSISDRFGTTYPFVNYTLDLNTGSLVWTDPRCLIYGFGDCRPRPVYMSIDYNCGYPLYVLPEGQTRPPLQSDVVCPEDLRQAILLTLASLYENRGDDDTTIPKKALVFARSYYRLLR